MKKLISLLLSLTMICPLTVTAFAAEKDTITDAADKMKTYSVEEVMQLEPYVSQEEGLFVLDADTALANGIDENLVNGQMAYFEYINGQVSKGTLVVHDDLTITSTADAEAAHIHARAAGHWSSCGGGKNTATTNHWWGYERYACDCETRRMSSDFASSASVAAGVGVIGAYFGGVGAIPGGLSSAYFALVAARLDANNHGKGVHIQMTWALVFDIDPQ